MQHMCMIVIKEKYNLEGSNCRKLRGNVMWKQNLYNELVSPPAARWRDQHALPPLGLNCEEGWKFSKSNTFKSILEP